MCVIDIVVGNGHCDLNSGSLGVGVGSSHCANTFRKGIPAIGKIAWQIRLFILDRETNTREGKLT